MQLCFPPFHRFIFSLAATTTMKINMVNILAVSLSMINGDVSDANTKLYGMVIPLYQLRMFLFFLGIGKLARILEVQ